VGVASGGPFRTTDEGATWTPITDGRVPLGSTGCVPVAESDPNVIYLGIGSGALRSNVSPRTALRATNSVEDRDQSRHVRRGAIDRWN
jgi:hypothetical protein